jgi:hypothetical protein
MGFRTWCFDVQGSNPIAVLCKIRKYRIPLLSGGSADNDRFWIFRVCTYCGRVRVPIADKTIASKHHCKENAQDRQPDCIGRMDNTEA